MINLRFQAGVSFWLLRQIGSMGKQRTRCESGSLAAGHKSAGLFGGGEASKAVTGSCLVQLS
jgi:hypothetical protein